MATTLMYQQLLVLSAIEFILHLEVPKDNGISHKSCCYGSMFPWQLYLHLNNSIVLSCIKFILDMDVSWHNRD